MVVQICGVFPCLSYELLATPQGACKFVEYFHVFPMSYLRRCKGPAVPERDLQNMDGEKIDWRQILSNHDDAQEHVEGNTGCIGFPHLFIGFPSVMVVIANL